MIIIKTKNSLIMETIKVTAPEGYIPVFDEEKREISFKDKPKNVRERINGWEDILAYHSLTQKKFEKSCEGLYPHEVATREVELIVAAYNEGKIAVHGDGNEKRVPYYDASGGGFRFDLADYWLTHSTCGSRLCYIGDDAFENACDAGVKFIEHYKRHLTL
jgi:hypothetical protein